MACKAPRKLADGTEVACRECELCQLKAKNDWIGRNLAEAKSNKFAYVITATYGRGRVGEVLHERAVILTYSDVQKLFKLLRRHGYEFRLFVTGEYGSQKQRAHWNIILYSDDPLPAFAGWDHKGRWTDNAREKQMVNWVRTDDQGQPVMRQNGSPAYWWPHGHIHWEKVTVGNVRYVCKYVLKDLDANGKQGQKGQSKDPPLGTKYFRGLAERYVRDGLAPQSPEYRFDEARMRDGAIIAFWLKGRPLEMFIQHYIDMWAERRGQEPRPRSDMVDLFEQYGRVIRDEAAYLLRLEFPDGESREAMPSPAEWRRHRDEVELRKMGRAQEEREEWLYRWIEGAENEQERQKREEGAVADRERAARERIEWRHAKGYIWQVGKGWFKSDAIEQCQCESVHLHARGSGPVQEGQHVVERRERVEWDDWLGPVGRYNADHAEARPRQTSGAAKGA